MSAVTIEQLRQTLEEMRRTSDRQRVLGQLWRMIKTAQSTSRTRRGSAGSSKA